MSEEVEAEHSSNTFLQHQPIENKTLFVRKNSALPRIQNHTVQSLFLPSVTCEKEASHPKLTKVHQLRAMRLRPESSQNSI